MRLLLGERTKSRVDLLDAIYAGLREREASRHLIHICSRTLVDGAGGDETSLRVFTELVGQLEAQEAIALERLHVAELEGELKRVRLESHGWKAEAATAAEELQTLRLQLAASTRIRHAVPHPPPSASDGAAGGCSTSSAADGEPSST